MRALILAAAIACASPALAQDARIQTVDYDPDKVVSLRGAIGYQVMIEFSPEERIENVSIGDSLAWQVTPNRRANILFLKPVEGGATNMTVVTDHRRYVFDLSVAPESARGEAPYALRFAYPAPMVAKPVPAEPDKPPQIANAAYSVTGSKESSPVRVFDDGKMTYFEWGPDGALPAIFAVNPDGTEALVNFVVRGPFIVVDQIAAKFSLRNGARVATVVNTAYPAESGRRARR